MNIHVGQGYTYAPGLGVENDAGAVWVQVTRPAVVRDAVNPYPCWYCGQPTLASDRLWHDSRGYKPILGERLDLIPLHVECLWRQIQFVKDETQLHVESDHKPRTAPTVGKQPRRIHLHASGNPNAS